MATQTIASLPTGTGTAILPISFIVDATATGTIINTAEISVDNGDDCDSTPDQIIGNDTLSDDVIGSQCDTNTNDEDDHDIAIITIGNVVIQPTIEVLKFSANTADTDGNLDDSNVTNDSQGIIAGGTAVFRIVVTNSGPEDLTGVILSDALAPACSRTIAQTDLLITAIGNNDAIFNIGESFSYDCSDTGVTADYTNTIVVDATGIISGLPATDTDTSFVDIPSG